MKFLHVADLHLDRSFEGLGPVPTALLKNLSQKNQQLLTNLVDLAIKEAVDFVLIVGDTFHQPLVTIQTQVLFMQEMERLGAAKIPVILSFGNHDYYLAEKYWFDFPDNVHVIKTEDVVTIDLVTKNSEQVAISGFSYNQRWLNKSKVGEFPQRKSGATYHIGLYHGELGQVQHQEQGYAPFSVSELGAKDYDYWALGHVHQAQVLQESPAIIYPGTPVGHSKKEKESAGFLIVEFNGTTPIYQWHDQKIVQWQTLVSESADQMEPKELLVQLENDITTFTQGVEQLSLIEIVLISSPSQMNHLATMNGWQTDLLLYLQDKIYRESQGKVWPYRITQKVNQEAGKLPFGVSSELIEQLVNVYLNEDRFGEIAEGLYRQRELRELLPNQEDLRASQVESALALIIQELGFENEDSL